MGGAFGYEYRSEREFFGLPLLHIVGGRGFDPATGKLRIAKGIIAVGPVAMGGVAFGGLSVGLVSFGGVAIGLLALGGAAIGVLLALGGLAIGYVGSAALRSDIMPSAAGAFGVQVPGGNRQDPNRVESFKSLLDRRFRGS